MIFAMERLYRRLGRGYILLYVLFEFVSAVTITAGTVGLFSLYIDVSAAEFLRTLLVAEAATLAALLLVVVKSTKFAMPLLRWIARPSRDKAHDAWRTAVTLPREYVAASGWQPFALVSVPVAVYAALEFDLAWYGGLIIFAGSLVAVSYAAILHFFASEVALRPILKDVTRQLPAEFAGEPAGVSLRTKLLGALPLINVITGVVVSGLASEGQATLDDLGVDVMVAVLVAFTLSFELTLLLSKSLLQPIDDLLEATDSVKQGDLSARVPIVSGDEMGRLAASFNEMLKGLEERETLRDAFGSYVAPEVAERVLSEGELLEGDEVEATLMFVDVRDFTSFADRASAREAVAYLNEFFGLVVPIVSEKGGHANKFIGDGLLAVFGAPVRHDDHADRAVSAACEIARKVEERFGERLRIGIGVNAGPVMAGSIGGGGRLEFTVIGDPVNLAARVEALTRELDEVVLITEAARALLTREDIEIEPRGSVEVRGKSEPVPVYAPRIGSGDEREERRSAAALESG